MNEAFSPLLKDPKEEDGLEGKREPTADAKAEPATGQRKEVKIEKKELKNAERDLKKLQQSEVYSNYYEFQ